jgi:hypothetical protein
MGVFLLLMDLSHDSFPNLGRQTVRVKEPRSATLVDWTVVALLGERMMGHCVL